MKRFCSTFKLTIFRQIKVLRRSQSSSSTADIIKLFPLIGFCTLCFYFPTKMLHLDAPFFPLKMSLKCSVNAYAKGF